MAILELRKKAQVTIPYKLVKKLGLKLGDKLEVIEKDGGIFITPVVVYPKNEMERIEKLIRLAEEDRGRGYSKVYDNVNEAFKDMGFSLDDLQDRSHE